MKAPRTWYWPEDELLWFGLAGLCIQLLVPILMIIANPELGWSSLSIGITLFSIFAGFVVASISGITLLFKRRWAMGLGIVLIELIVAVLLTVSET